MIPNLGNFKEDATVYIMFNTFSSDDPSASCTITNFAGTDVHIHKDDGLAQRNNAAGITVSIDFDGITGSHMIKIDTGDNTVAGFWVIGHDYFVRIEGTTIDGGTVNAVVGHFSLENRFSEVDVVKWLSQAVTLSTGNKPDVNIDEISDDSTAPVRLEASAKTIVTGAAVAGTLSTTEMTTDLTEATNDHYNGRIIIWTSGVLKDQATNITDYVGATKKLVYTAVTEAPSEGNSFVII